MRFSAQLIAVLLLIALPGAAMAQTTVGSLGSGSSATASNNNGVQSLLAPAGVMTLDEVSVGVAHRSAAPENFTISVHRDVAGAPGPAVETSGTFATAVPISSLTYTTQAFTLSAPMAVTAGERLYISVNAVPDTALWAVGSDYYADGNLIENGVVRTDLDTYFQASFTPLPPVPTLTEWAMILLGLGLAGAAMLVIQRRRLTA